MHLCRSDRCGRDAVRVTIGLEPKMRAERTGSSPPTFDSTISREAARDFVVGGRPFKVVGAALDAPMLKEGWTCDFFKESEDFKKAEIMQSYGAGGGRPRFAALDTKWEALELKTGAKDPKAPQLSPFYWGIKDLQYDDAPNPRTWTQRMLKKVQEKTWAPSFLGDVRRELQRTPEFWFSRPAAGAQAKRVTRESPGPRHPQNGDSYKNNLFG